MIIKNMAYWKAKNSPINKKSDNDDKDVTIKTVDVDHGGGNIATYENPYLAYQMKNIPKKDLTGAPVGGPRVASNVSGLEVSGQGSGRKRTDKMLKGDRDTKAYMIHGLNKKDKDKSGLPDEFERGMSKEVRDLGADRKGSKGKTSHKGVKTDREKFLKEIQDFRKSHLTLDK